MVVALVRGMGNPARVLVADVPEADDKIRECLPDRELVFVRSLGQAIRALRADGFQLVIIGMHFDESRMFELLQYVKALPDYRDVPVICVQCLEVALADAVLKNMDDAVKSLGGTAFVDLRDHALHFRSHCESLERLASQATGPTAN
jgi:PleD family two-component response regulator